MSARIAKSLVCCLSLSLLLPALLAGCASRPPLPRVKLPEFQEGKTTRIEVLKQLGEPLLASHSEGHGMLFRYVEGDRELSNEAHFVGRAARDAGVLRMGSLSFIFNEKGILEQQMGATAVLPVVGGNQGRSVGPPLDAGVMGKWQRGRTSMNDIYAQLGEPAAQLLSFKGGLVLVWMRIDYFQFQKAGVHSECVAVRFSGSGVAEEFGLMGRDQAFQAFP